MIRSFVAGILLVPWLAAATPTFAQAAPCQYVLGFETLHDLDPSDIGDCIDNQAFAANGDAQQHTTKGLLAWRKADNWTAFTNGYWTWINGPNGLAKRLNSQRYSWEANPENLSLADGGSAASVPTAARNSPPDDDTAWSRWLAAKYPMVGGVQLSPSVTIQQGVLDTNEHLVSFIIDDTGNNALAWIKLSNSTRRSFVNSLLQDTKAHWPNAQVSISIEGIPFYTTDGHHFDDWYFQSEDWTSDKGWYTISYYARAYYFLDTGDDIELPY